METDRSDAVLDELEGWRLLPWFANGTLQGEELELVLEHLRTSSAAREELLFLSELRHAVEIASKDQLEPSAERFERLLRRIDEHEAGVEPADVARFADPPVSAPPEPRFAASTATSPAKMIRGREWAAWGAAAAAALLLVSILWRPPTTDSAGFAEGTAVRFRTLSEEDVGARTSGWKGQTAHIRVIFEQATTEASLRELLLESGLEIVSGPTVNGAYSLRPVTRLDGNSDVEGVLRRLRQDRRVAFAEVALDG